MNQIICTNHSNIEFPNKNFKKIYLLKLQFYILITIAIILTLNYIYFRYTLYKSEKISKELINNFNITSLYSNNSNYSANLVNKEIYFYEGNSFSVIGIIKIPKINIVYPILSEISNDLLKVATCRFYGPNPNEVGNLCIAAHNYNSHFGQIKYLGEGDEIIFTDVLGDKYRYVVAYTEYIDGYNPKQMSENKNSSWDLTLFTCTLNGQSRVTVRAKLEKK